MLSIFNIGAKRLCAAIFSVFMLSMSLSANATMLRISVQNNASVGGLAFTPLYTAFHSAAFDAFNAGMPASNGLALLAELGDASGIRDERVAVDPGSQGAIVFPEAGMRPLFPGEFGSILVDIADPASNTFFTFLSMILPSNDTFIGLDNAIRIFSDTGDYLGNKVLEVTGADIWDAGSEALDITAAPFIPGNSPGDSPTDTSNLVRAGESLDAFAGLTLANGQVLDANLIDFLSNPSAFSVATITIERVSAPNVMALFAAALIFLGLRKDKIRYTRASAK